MKAALPALVSILALAACVPATKTPPAQVAAPSRPAPARPAPVQAPTMTSPTSAETNWMDIPATAGDWAFTAFPFGSQAMFRGPAGMETALSLSCNAQSRQVTLLRLGRSDRPLSMRILTETASRSGIAEPVAEQFPGVVLRLDPNDPLLDAMALSKGRFAVEVEGLAPLYLPSHAEVSRVIEDCRG